MLKFPIYVAGDALNSTQAIANLAALCRTYLPDRHQIEVAVVFKDPNRALVDGIFLTQTLIKIAPYPPEESSAHSVRHRPCCWPLAWKDTSHELG